MIFQLVFSFSMFEKHTLGKPYPFVSKVSSYLLKTKIVAASKEDLA